MAPKAIPKPESILVIKTSSLGDIVCALPVLTQLRRLYPAAHIAWVVDHRFADLLDGHPFLDQVYVFQHHRLRAGTGAWSSLLGFLSARRALAQRLRERSWDVALDLQSLFKSAVILAASRARVRIAAFSQIRHLPVLLGANRLVCAARGHAIERYLQIAAPLGVKADEVEFCLHVCEEARRWAEDKLAGLPRPWLVVNPGSAVAAKRWPPEAFAEAAGWLVEGRTVGSIIVTGASQDRPAADLIARAAGEAVANLAGQTSLSQLAAVLSLSDAMLTNDTGPMHMMAALGKPVVALFGPTNPALNGPWGRQHVILKASDGRVASIAPAQAVRAVEEVLRRVRG